MKAVTSIINKRIYYVWFCDKGMALALVLIFTAALMILGAAVITFAVNERLITAYNNSDIRLYYIVEGGLETGLAVLREDFYYNDELNGSLREGTFTVYFTDEYQHYNENRKDEEEEEYFENEDKIRFIRCVGTLGENSKAMSIAAEQDEQGRLYILRWYRIFPYH